MKAPSRLKGALIVLSIALLLLAGCSCRRGAEDSAAETAVLEGVITVKGNEPFQSLYFRDADGTVYQIADRLTPDFLESAGKKMKIRAVKGVYKLATADGAISRRIPYLKEVEPAE